MATDFQTPPGTRTWIHIAFKGVQAGSIIGTVIGPTYSIVRRRPLTAATFPAGAMYGALIMTPVLLAMGVGRLKDVDEAGLRERDVKLSHNDAQQLMDILATSGFTGGVAVGAVMPSNMRLRTALLGNGCLGVAIGCSAFAVGTALSTLWKKSKQL